MRERLERRKKKAEAEQPAPPPLQPAYFEADEGPKTTAESPASEPQETEPAAARSEEAGTDAAASKGGEQATGGARGGQGRRGRGRRRGGRGRGGRGREKAVAEAFTPKGVPSSGAEEPEAAEAEPAAAEPVAEAAESVPAPQAAAVPEPVRTPRPPKGVVVLAIGLPGSGKSSWFKRHDLTPLSSDIMRTLLFDDVREQRFQDLVFSNLRSMLKARLIAKRPMNYVDATNLTPQERQHWIKLAKDYNYEVHAVFFDVPLEVCIERHQRRDRVVPEDIMRRMAAKLKPPTFEEGFAKITVVRVKKKEA